MNAVDIQALNEQLAIPDQIAFAHGPGGLPVAEIRNAHANVTIGVQGAHVIAYQPHGQAPVLWASGRAIYAAGQPIRGGIPVCWPWFGSHPTDRTRPSHGFVRTALWQVLGTAVVGDATQVRLSLTDDEQTRALWPHAFVLELVVTVGTELRVELIARNSGESAFTCTGALHSYFGVADVTAITIAGLDGSTYLDQLDSMRRKPQLGPVTIAAETDRIYVDTTAECVITDPRLGRLICNAKEGSRSTVVWNPWVAKSQRLKDMGDMEYLGMVCIETANAGGDVITVAPGDEHRLSAVISVEPG